MRFSADLAVMLGIRWLFEVCCQNTSECRQTRKYHDGSTVVPFGVLEGACKDHVPSHNRQITNVVHQQRLAVSTSWCALDYKPYRCTLEICVMYLAGHMVLASWCVAGSQYMTCW